jgi:hypothetical protein
VETIMSAIDEIEVTRTVLFVGDYFALTTTVVLDEKLRYEDEDDDDFAVRIASVLLEEHYGWDVAEKSNDIGVVDEDADEW